MSRARGVRIGAGRDHAGCHVAFGDNANEAIAFHDQDGGDPLLTHQARAITRGFDWGDLVKGLTVDDVGYDLADHKALLMRKN